MTEEKYTAETITWLHTWVPGKLFSLRCTRDPGFRFTAGQFARLGVKPRGSDEIVWRAYSMVSSPHDEHLEFFSIVVEGGLFTGALEHLRVGDTVYVEKTAYGFLTIERFAHDVPLERSLWMLASGTGLAPFLSMLTDLAVWEQFGPLVLVHSVRTREELAYADTLRALPEHPVFGEFLRENPARLRYLPVVTREHVPGALSHRITELLADGELERAAGLPLDPAQACVMLCGNPEMVRDLRKLVQERGFRAPRRGQPGNLAVENYW
ncbi:ferredoxin--NADP reductase [Verticiella sediminum]|uniref:ferredoxin--NADP(+) reductase n=1 Tax=Verticiella sediminum TaxID=1247510 RepID=A0A556AY46_9BURK|nr:ferredoxin--NADP reductase [Verticiella sediminum]TSH97849.1 ferredoxin--NADP reductase [Verticiella sediminum]